jgi:hypothetical protein
MGNISITGGGNGTSVNGPKKQGEALEPSPQELSQTIVDDRLWLGVSEENLLHESFTNDKFFALNSTLNSRFF